MPNIERYTVDNLTTRSWGPGIGEVFVSKNLHIENIVNWEDSNFDESGMEIRNNLKNSSISKKIQIKKLNDLKNSSSCLSLANQSLQKELEKFK